MPVNELNSESSKSSEVSLLEKIVEFGVKVCLC